ncbi:hypothetical protein Poli38472_003637 [Pythium oligandrum]|uniref:PDZ domain-containing protein n=1 Tax=Pythium oligandrum TaxID=41045 RepID=A0A8K1CLT7_PYTOL|nr:hypothetical protein Poli38472_003637 [Pythium oligandrum]|eukprot:TMW65872.1 hypothetical protein Poli38472_003637 [Pythium oligandrum]
MDTHRKRMLMLAEQGEWEEAVALIEENAVLAKAQDDFGMLPLHWASTEPEIELEVFRTIINAFPEACEIENMSGMVPLHVAIKSKMPGLHINRLLQTYPEAALIKDGNGRYPVELAMECSLPKFTLDLIRKAGAVALQSTSLMDRPRSSYSRSGFKGRSPSFASTAYLGRSMSFMSRANSFDGMSMHSVDLYGNQDSDSSDSEDYQKQAIMKAQSLSTFLSTRDPSELLGDKVPTPLNPMETVEISGQLKELMSQLQQLSVDIRTNSSRSTESTYRSSFSSSSSNLLSPTNGLKSVLWNPGDKLGLVLEPVNGGTGAQIKRIESKSNALGVESLSDGDILVSINGASVTGTSHASIIRFMKHSKATCTLCFTKSSTSTSFFNLKDNQVDQEAALFAKVADLLDTTMKKVTAVEETVRLSSAMSFCA